MIPLTKLRILTHILPWLLILIFAFWFKAVPALRRRWVHQKRRRDQRSSFSSFTSSIPTNANHGKCEKDGKEKNKAIGKGKKKSVRTTWVHKLRFGWNLKGKGCESVKGERRGHSDLEAAKWVKADEGRLEGFLGREG